MTNPTPPLESLHDTASELLEGYVLAALQPAEAAVVDEHLDEGCEDCEENVGVLVRIAQSLPLASRLVTPAGDLKTRVLAAVAAGDVGGVDDDAAPAMTRRERRPIPIWSARRFQAVAAAIGLVAIGGLLAWAIVLQSEVDNLQGENVALSAMVDSSAERLDGNMATALFSLAGENSSSLQFVANETNRGAAARMLWDADEDTVVLAALGLEPTGEGGVYVTWAEMQDGSMVKLTDLSVGRSGTSLVIVSTAIRLKDVKSITITHEDHAAVSVPSRHEVLTFSR